MLKHILLSRNKSVIIPLFSKEPTIFYNMTGSFFEINSSLRLTIKILQENITENHYFFITNLLTIPCSVKSFTI